MSSPRRIVVEGRPYVLVAPEEYRRLVRLARVAELPPLPKSDARGHRPAVAYARASIAREIVRRRAQLGLSQRELARRAGIRFETVCRIETGRHTASTATIAKLEQALEQVPSRPGRR